MPIVKAKSGIYCDTCKDAYGWAKDENGRTVPHPKAKRQAYITTISETHFGREPITRSLCYQCVDEASKWHDGTVWTLASQLEYAKANRKGQQLSIVGA